MKKCVICGKKIVHEYYWDGKVYGKECWKKHCLQEYLEWQKERLEAWNLKCRLLVEVLKMKDMGRIKNQWKRNFVESVIQQFEEKNRMSRKQYDTAMSLLNNKDMINLYNMMFELELVDEKEYWYKMRDYAPVRSKLYKEAEKKVEAYEKAEYIEAWRRIADELERLKPYRNLIHNMLDALESGEMDEDYDYAGLFSFLRECASFLNAGKISWSMEWRYKQLQEAIERWGN